MRKVNKSVIDVIYEIAIMHSLSRVQERRLILAWLQMHDVCNIDDNVCNIQPEHLQQVYRHWRSQGSTAENLKKRMGYIKRILRFAYHRGYIKSNPGEMFRLPPMQRGDVVSLTKEQINVIAALPLQLPRHILARDLFIFQCYTGMAYTDLHSFGPAMVQNYNGTKLIMGRRKKTGADYVLPFLPEAMAVAAKYDYRLPKLSNAYYNRLLKDIGSLARLQTVLTTHVGRRTFGQMMLDKGVSMEAVSKMMGHKSIVITERHYARVSLLRVILELGGLAA